MTDDTPSLDIRPIIVYLAGPVDEPDDNGQSWRELAATKVTANVLLFSPPHAFIGTANVANARALRYFNSMAIQTSDVVVVNLTTSHQAFGTIREVEFARLNDKPVVIWSRQALVSLMSFDCSVEDTLEGALSKAAELVSHLRNQPFHQLAFMRLFGREADTEE